MVQKKDSCHSQLSSLVNTYNIQVTLHLVLHALEIIQIIHYLVSHTLDTGVIPHLMLNWNYLQQSLPYSTRSQLFFLFLHCIRILHRFHYPF